MIKKKEFKNGMKGGIPIALGYFAVSFTFGMMAVKSGISPLMASVISLTNVTSAGQFAGLSIIAANGPYIEMALTQAVINLRYALMSFSLSQKLDRSEPHIHKYFLAFGVTDEIFAITASLPHTASAYYMYGAMSVAIPGWVLGTLSGGILQGLLPTSILSAFGIAIYGMFLAIIIPPAKKESSVLLTVLGAFAASAFLYYVPTFKQISSGFSIIIVTVLISATAAIKHPVTDEN